MTYDAVIIGGGPAGAAAGLALANSGASVCIIEHTIFPRRKTCAGILTEKTVKLLQIMFPKISLATYDSTNDVTLLSGGSDICVFSTQYPFVLIDRESFDYELLRACKRVGVHVVEGAETTLFLPQKSELVLHNGIHVSYGVLIAADGVHSQIRKRLGIPNIQKGFCVQDIINREFCSEPLLSMSGLRLSFGDLAFGYSWVIPNRTHIIVGTGVLEDNSNWKNAFETHLKLCNRLDLPTSAVRTGAYVPIGQLTDQETHPYENIVFIGDAAGLAHPLTGEGIYYALLSGQLACNAYLQNKTRFRTTYLSCLKDTADSLSKDAGLLQQFYSDKIIKNFAMQLKDCPEYLASICDDVISINKRDFDSVLLEIQHLLK